MTLDYPYISKQEKLNPEKWINCMKKFVPIVYKKIPDELRKCNIKPYKDGYFIVKDEFMKTKNINSLTDHFTEEQRVICKTRNNPSPLDYWKKHKQKVIEKCLKKYGKITIFLLRETMYNSTRICNNFKITVSLTILSHFKPKRWLDVSAGWGDRLLAAILSKYVQFYESTDPNLCLQDGYDKIRHTFVLPEERQNYIIHPTGFLEAKLSGTYDFVFSSPPFFDEEVYSTCVNDSISTFNSNESWISNFMIPALRKCKDHLIKNGIMVIYIHSEPNLDKALQEFDNTMDRLGSMYFYDNVKPRHMYVWRKI